MPELPEVQTVVDTLRRALAAAGGPGAVRGTIAAVAHLRDDMVTCPPDFDLRRTVAGRSIVNVTRRGKRIVLHLDDENRMYVHLGMTGRLTVEHADAAARKHTHMVLSLADGREIRFADPRRFGAIVWLGREGTDEAAMGPEPLAVRPAELLARLRQTRRAIKTALLDQRLIAGIGNIYADEALFAAEIDPRTPADRLTVDQVRRLCGAIKRVLRRAIRHRGSTLRDYVDADGAGGRFQLLHRVYDREGHPCPACGRPIRRIVLGGRSTHFCPYCQKIRPRK